MFVQADWWEKKINKNNEGLHFQYAEQCVQRHLQAKITPIKQHTRKFSVHVTRAHRHGHVGVRQGLKHLSRL